MIGSNMGHQSRKKISLLVTTKSLLERGFRKLSLTAEYLSTAYQRTELKKLFKNISIQIRSLKNVLISKCSKKPLTQIQFWKVIFYSLDSELNLLLHKAIRIKDQVETTAMSGWEGVEATSEKAKQGTWRSFIIASIISVFPHGHSYCPLPSTGWRAASKVCTCRLESSPICRESLAVVCGVWGSHPMYVVSLAALTALGPRREI